MPALVATRNWLDEPGASVTVSSAATTMPASALLSRWRGEVWRSTGASPHTVQVDLGVERVVGVVNLAAPREQLLPEGGYLAMPTMPNILGVGMPGGRPIRAGEPSTIAEGGSLITATLARADGAEAAKLHAAFNMPRGYWSWILPAPVLARRLTLQMTTGNAYLQLGRIWVAAGLYHAPFHSEGEFDPSLSDQEGRGLRRSAKLVLSRLQESEADALETMAIAAGTDRQVLLIPRTERAEISAIMGTFTELPHPRPVQVWGPFGQWHRASLTVMEDR